MCHIFPNIDGSINSNKSVENQLRYLIYVKLTYDVNWSVLNA